VAYDDSSLDGENYINHLIAQEFRYAFTRRTTGALTYRYALADYDNGIGDYDSHYLLVGIDHKFSPRFSGGFRTGAEFRDRDFGGSQTDPYFEGFLSYFVSRRTDVRLYSRIGFQDSDIGTYGDRYGYRVGVTGNHRINSRLNGSLGLHYIHDQFEQGLFPSFDEDIVAFTAGLDYALWKNVSLNAGYSYTTTSNDALPGFRPEYDRHNVTVGFNARF
jgi:opacity protein-like surface antigen